MNNIRLTLQKKLVVSAMMAQVVLLVAAPYSYAQGVGNGVGNGNTAAAANTNAGGGGNFCARLTVISTKNLNKITLRSAKIQTKDTKKSTQVSSRRQKRDNKLAGGRSSRDTKLNQHFTNLRAKATTDAQKQAVETFITTVQTALSEKRTAIDAAKTAFRTGVDSATGTKFPTIEAALTAYQTAAQAAADKAKTDCANGVSDNVAKNLYQQSMMTAHMTFKDAVTGAAPLDGTVHQLAETRKQAFDAARNTFKLKMQAAILTIKAAMAKS